jgi:hypothetical protein
MGCHDAIQAFAGFFRKNNKSVLHRVRGVAPL